jgi:hypothetical protein
MASPIAQRVGGTHFLQHEIHAVHADGLLAGKSLIGRGQADAAEIIGGDHRAGIVAENIYSRYGQRLHHAAGFGQQSQRARLEMMHLADTGMGGKDRQAFEKLVAPAMIAVRMGVDHAVNR